MKKLAVKGDTKSARMLAKELVRSKKQKERLHVSKARLGSIGVQLTQQLGTCAHDVLLVRLLLMLCDACGSHAQGDRVTAEVDRDHEAVQQLGQAPPD